MLHITNGDTTADILKDAVFKGQILAWRDVLHEGPVPADLSLQELSLMRSEFIVSQGWGRDFEVGMSFSERDKLLLRFREQDEIVLWFEHDLYDQLQLLQLLDWFYERERGATKLSLICLGKYPGIHPFRGLGQLTSNQLASLFPMRQAVSYKQLKIGHLGWQAFTSPNSVEIVRLLYQNLEVLPYLAAALHRHLQQFPSTSNGLSRTEQQILQAIDQGNQTLSQIFDFNQQVEEAAFMGDWVLWSYINRLCNDQVPLIALADGSRFKVSYEDITESFLAQNLTLTAAGRSVLEGKTDQIELNGIDRWLGGVQLQGNDVHWRWSGKRLVTDK